LFYGGLVCDDSSHCEEASGRTAELCSVGTEFRSASLDEAFAHFEGELIARLMVLFAGTNLF